MNQSRMPILALLATAGLVAAGCAKTADAKERSTEALGRQGITLTVYADDFAQVSERRAFELKSGANRLRLGEVSRTLDPSSTLFNWGEPALQVVSNTYDLGVGDQQNLMKRYLGQDVEVVRYGQNGRPGETETGRLELVNGNGVVVRAGDKLLIDPQGTIVAPAKADLVTMPQLTLGVESPKGGKTDLDLTYLTRGLSWSADYVFTLDPGSDKMRLECWATVTNRTGVDFPTSKVTLMAGSPNRAATPMRRASLSNVGGYAYDPKTLAEGERSGFDMDNARLPFSTGELYAYPIDAKVDIKQDQLNRVRMLVGDTVTVKKDYSVRLDDYRYGASQNAPINATLALAFLNKKEAGLGLPLPRGTVRVYEPGSDRDVRYVGAAGLSDTPLEGRIDLTLSNVFDVTALPKLVSTQKVGKNQWRKAYFVELSNQKAGPVELRIVKPFGGKWVIEKESAKSTKLNAYTAQWSVNLPPKSKTKLEFVVLAG